MTNFLLPNNNGMSRKLLLLVLAWSFSIFIIIHLIKLNSDLSIPTLMKSSNYSLNRRLTQDYPENPELFDDKRPSLTESELLEDIKRKLPSLPIVWKSPTPTGLNATCAKFPNYFELNFNNIYWQTFRTRNGTFELYNAYLDNRENNPTGSTVRITVMLDRIEPNISTYCQLWFENKREPVIVQTLNYDYMWLQAWGYYRQDIYQPYLVSCVIPETFQDQVPHSVSLVENPCDNASNNLVIFYDKPEVKKDFAVCVKGLDFVNDISVRLIEWIELLNLLGADKIYFYEMYIHENVSKVLKYYEEKNKIQVTPTTLPGKLPNLPSLQHLYLKKYLDMKRLIELLPYNDCFYKNMYKYKYIALLDIDEVIMPLNNATSWRELFETIQPKFLARNTNPYGSFNVRNAYFLDDFLHAHGWFKDIPKYMHMLQHIYRAKNFTKPGYYVKCFHNTETVLTLHNHYPRACVNSAFCRSYNIEVTDAQLQHYRADCASASKNVCDELKKTQVMDSTIWRFKEPLIERVNTALKDLKFLY